MSCDTSWMSVIVWNRAIKIIINKLKFNLRRIFSRSYFKRAVRTQYSNKIFQFKKNITKNLSNFRFISNNPINFIEIVNSIITNTIEKLITTKIEPSSFNMKHLLHFINTYRIRLQAERLVVNFYSCKNSKFFPDLLYFLELFLNHPKNIYYFRVY